MKIRYHLIFLLLVILLMAVTGCGSGTGNGTASALAASQQCIGCHATNSVNISPVTGVNITFEWLSSVHSKSLNGAGCNDCHTTAHLHNNLALTDCLACHSSHNHPDSCGQCHGGSTKTTNCLDCHATAHKDPNSCGDCHDGTGQVKASVNNPDVAGRCLGCHNTLGAPHFSSNLSGTTHNAQFVDQQNAGKCRNCHNPHNNTILPAAKAWGISAHGDVKGPAWSDEDFKADARCVRCHTATGYVDYVTGTPAFALPTAPLAASPTYGVLGCNACHKNYNFTNHTSVRKIAAYTAPYNNSLSPKTFPNVGDSNLCIACHSGRESGDTIAAITDFTNASFKNSHYMAAAATMYMSNAFINFTTLTAPAPSNNEGTPFTSTKSYAKTLLPDNASTPSYGISGGQTSTHRKLGTPLITGSENYLNYPAKTSNPKAPFAINTNGPCVTCHMQANNPIPGNTAQNSGIPVPDVRPGSGHSLKIDDAAAQQLCLPCHADAPHLDGGDGAGNALYTTITTFAQFQTAMLEPQSAAFQNGLNLVKQLLLVKYMIKYDPTAYPYFYDLQIDPSGKTAVTDWTRKNVAGVSDAAVIALGTANVTVIPTGGFSQKLASRVMGACFNLNLLFRDPGAYVHARTFSQRLVYDTVDFLDNNLMDFTPLATARVLNSTVYSGKECNVLISAPVGGLATESMAWLAGTHYSDSKGQTSVPLKLRP